MRMSYLLNTHIPAHLQRLAKLCRKVRNASYFSQSDPIAPRPCFFSTAKVRNALYFSQRHLLKSGETYCESTKRFVLFSTQRDRPSTLILQNSLNQFDGMSNVFSLSVPFCTLWVRRLLPLLEFS